jgi:hypothetical protein
MQKQKVWIGIFTLIASIIVSLVYFTRETFTNYASQYSTNNNINFCPFDSIRTTYKTNEICCDELGATGTGSCKGKTVCSMSSDSADIPSCGRVYREYLIKAAKDQCPKSLPYYYEKNGKSFCFGGEIGNNYGPASDNTDKCNIYKNGRDQTNDDSCFNRKILDGVACLTPNKLCKKGMMTYPAEAKMPALIWQTYMANKSMFGGNKIASPSFCYDDKSFNAFFDKMEPGWRTKYKVTSNDLGWICGAAEAVYVKGTRLESSLKYK